MGSNGLLEPQALTHTVAHAGNCSQARDVVQQDAERSGGDWGCGVVLNPPPNTMPGTSSGLSVCSVDEQERRGREGKRTQENRTGEISENGPRVGGIGGRESYQPPVLPLLLKSQQVRQLRPWAKRTI